MNDSMNVEIQRVAEGTLQDLRTLFFENESIPCELKLGGKSIIDQQVWLTVTEIQCEPSGFSVRFELRPARTPAHSLSGP